MGINVALANNQANQLNSYIYQLNQSKTNLIEYRTSIINSWQGDEIVYIKAGIEQAINQIDSAIKQINNLSNNINNTVAAIRREEIAAEAAARAAALKQQRIQAAQNDYNAADSELNRLVREKEQIVNKLRNASGSQFTKLKDDLNKIEAGIIQAQKRFNDASNALTTARR